MKILKFLASARGLLMGAALLLLLPYGLGALSSNASAAADAVQPIRLTTTPLPLNRDDPGQTRIGALAFLGAVQVRSTAEGFGGISGLQTDGRGQFLAVTDTGNWLAFRSIERGGRLVGLEGAVTAPLLDTEGMAAIEKADADAESLAWDPATGAVTIGFEQDHRLMHYAGIDPRRPETLARSATRTERWAGMVDWPRNGGAESLAVLPGGARLVIAEDPSHDGGHLALLDSSGEIGGGEIRRLGIPGLPEHRPTDAVALDATRVLVLHRRFNLRGQGAGLTLIDLAPALAGGTHVPSTELARWEAPVTLDNMEGLAIARSGDRVFLYIVSDDNLNSLQATIVMKFELLLPQ
ncbi:hypothetical protein GCM10007973_24430 [Polymorphobacter multimanifer]|uniref:Phytase-like domain-containing protein n=1 Tax=Polymorphobacter multimanifer TaxID=1070431 RepID=A0A841L2I8_9SPHN|nr:esterase-like activity of phytase family protein [Polymorphobacter multimanifer]MBB6227029.1 hypothetical protein [Polymorphobacter multimanifer]GGI87114.1 hypothetical protein GCM10007973_24430 [Polymorphobacter multimanifer]